MKKIIYVFSAMFLFSCSEDKLQSENQIEEEQGFVTESTSRGGDGLDDVLGQGYDVTKDYANSNFAKAQVIDVNSFKTSNPSGYYSQIPASQTHTEVYAENYLDYTRTLTNKVIGNIGIGLFGGSVENSNSSTNTFDSKYVCGSCELKVAKKRIFLEYLDASDFNNYLSSGFNTNKDRITASNVGTFINMYGTHVMTNITTGACLRAFYRSQTTNSNRTASSESLVKFNYGLIANVSISNSSSSIDNSKNFDKTLYYSTRGGDNTIPASSITFTTAPTFNFTPWLATANNSTVLIDFGDESLIPIYEFVTDPAKKLILKNAVNTYLNAKKVTLTIPPPPPANVASFFQSPLSGGWAVSLPVGDYTQAQLFALGIQNDDISSMSVNAGYEVEMYPNSLADQQYRIAVAGYYGSLGNYDNVISAIKIKKVTPNVTTVYADGNYGGGAVGLSVGTYELRDLQARGIYNDWISSVKTNPGFRVKFHDNDHFTGANYDTSGWLPNLNASSFNDRTSSIEVYAN
jgi:MAC/Perforin domain